MNRYLVFALILAMLAPTGLGARWQQPPVRQTAAAVLSAPTLISPAGGETIPDFGPTLSWNNPAGTTQYHLEVSPYNGDGPGVQLHIGSPDTAFAIPAPPQWFGLLPDMTYSWRVRTSDSTAFVGLEDASWGPWASGSFRTPMVTSSTISAISPAMSASVDSLNPTLSWLNSRSDVFYYEIQLSKDASFTTDPATATAMVYWELRHGGATNPPNSYMVPAGFPLTPDTIYFWRLRPRIQGDGNPVAWSSNFTFKTSATAQPGGSVPPPPSGGGNPALSGSRILFVSNVNGPSDIFAVRPDGTGVVNLSNNAASDEEPAISKDGKKIAFTSDRDGNKEIYVMNADGTNQMRLTTSSALDCCANWSPDGTKITYISRTNGWQEVYVMNADGTGSTRITTVSANHWTPYWSPKGDKIVYGSQRGNNLDLFTASPTGSGEVDLTNNAAIEYSPAWSPDGSKLAFVSSRDGAFEIYVMNADGSTQVNVSKSTGNDLTPVWSPDGKMIAFTSDREGNQEVFVMNADGTGQRNLSRSSSADHSMTWSPDGKQIVFVSERDGRKQLYLVNVDGTGLKRILSDSADDITPMWVQ